MKCARVSIGGANAIVCGPAPKRRACRCGRVADLLCDWKVDRGGQSGTCDAPVCARCTTKPAPDKDLCPRHAGDWAAWKAARAAAPAPGGRDDAL